MKLSHRFTYLKSHQSHQKTIGKRTRAARPLRKLCAPFRTRFRARGVAVSLDFDLAAAIAVSHARPAFIFSEIDDVCVSGDAVMSRVPRDGRLGPEGSASLVSVSAPVHLPLRFARDFDGALDDFFSPPTRRVCFAELVTVVAIPSHRSLTDEEKNRLYRCSTTGDDKEKSMKERDFERSGHCFENACEEDMFFPNLEGVYVHPAHLSSFVRKVLPDVPRGTIVPGFLSFDDYYGVLGHVAGLYGVALPDRAVWSNGPFEV